MSIQEAALRLLLAAALGSLIGIDRERLDRAAGLRTHALVATTSALVMIVSAYGFDDALEPGRIVLDPSRVAAQVVSGVGFLGAGVIILRQNVIRGITTAASIWSVAGIGLAAGGGMYAVSTLATGVLLVILVALRVLERRFFNPKRLVEVTIRAARQPGLLGRIEEEAAGTGLEVRSVSVEPNPGGESTIAVDVRGGDRQTLAEFAERIRELPGVHRVSYSPAGVHPEDLETDDERR